MNGRSDEIYSTKRPELSCVIPAFNEEACIQKVLLELITALNERNIDYEIIVIDNGSSDGTTYLIEEVKRSFPKVKMIRFVKNCGYGGAILSGLSSSTGEIIGFTSADGETPPECLIQMYELIKSGHIDLCKAKRINRQDGFYRKTLSLGYHLLVELLFNLHIADINGYPILITHSAYKRLRLTKTDWMINFEILFQSRRAGFRIAEVDVKHRKRFGGASHIRWHTSLIMFCQILRIRWKIYRKHPGSLYNEAVVS